jgi:glycosyltransferase involved in cell wall biosynthesis
MESSFKNLPLVSVVVPAYNVEKYIYECIKSILNQNYENIEIIIVDDGSTDNTGVIVDELALKDSRVIAIHQNNKGVSAARNRGMDMANGEFIVFVDSDDWISSDHVAYFVQMQK